MWRWNVWQLMMVGALCALLAGLFNSGRQSADRQQASDVRVSPDGKLAAIIHSNDNIEIWSLAGDRPRLLIRNLTGQAASLISFGGSGPQWADSTTLVTPSRTYYLVEKLQFWDVGTKRLKNEVTIPLSQQDFDLTFSARGNRLAVTGNTVVVRDLTTWKPMFVIPQASPPQQLLLSPDGSRLVMCIKRKVAVHDTETGKQLGGFTLDTQSEHLIGISPDGRLLVTGRYAKPAGDEMDFRPMLTVRNVLDGSVEHEAETAEFGLYAFKSDNLFAPDKPWMLASTDEGTKVWDTSDWSLVGTLQDTHLNFRKYAFIPGTRRLIGLSGGSAAIWDLDSGEPVAQMWSDWSWINAGLFCGGLIVWAVIWGLLTRPKDAQPVSVPGRDAVQVPVPTGAVKPGSVRMGYAALVVIGLLPACIIVLSMSDESIGMKLLAFVGTLVLVPVALIAAVFVWQWIQRRFYGSYSNEVGRAVGISERSGRMLKLGNLTVWLAGRSRLEPQLADAVDTARRRYVELTGTEMQELPPALLLVFDCQADLQAYSRYPLQLGAIYSGTWFDRQMMICESRCEEMLMCPRRVLIRLVAYHALYEQKRFWPPFWVQAVLSAYVVDEGWQADEWDDETAGLVQAVHRRLRVARQRGEDVSLKALFEASPRELLSLITSLDQRESFVRFQTIQDLSTSLAAFLMGPERGSRRVEFVNFFRSLRRRTRLEPALQDHLGADFEQLDRHWSEWLAEQPVDGFVPLPLDRKRRLAEWCVPLALNSENQPQRRMEALRTIGSCGDVAAIGSLLQLLDQLGDSPGREGADLKTDAVWAVEALSGRLYDEAAMRSWWEALDEPLRRLNAPPQDVAGESASASEVGASEVGASEVGADWVDAELVDGVEDAGVDKESIVDGKRPDDLSGRPNPAKPPVAAPAARPVFSDGSMTQIWAWMSMGGLAAIVFGSFMISFGFWYLPNMYYSVLVGVTAMAAGVSRRRQHLRWIGVLQILNIVSCDIINVIAGSYVYALASKAERTYGQLPGCGETKATRAATSGVQSPAQEHAANASSNSPTF